MSTQIQTGEHFAIDVIDPLESHSVQEPTQADNEPRSLFKQRDFRLLWLGEGISLLGDQFSMIALPWLVLQLTGDALAVGTVLALGGIPRALFMLLGGAFVDRFTPRLVMLNSNLVRMVLVLVLSAIILEGQVELWMLYVYALLFGLADAFFFPAQNSIVPRLVKSDQLPSANAIIQGTAQFSVFLGPVLAGSLIALFATGVTQVSGEVVPELQGIGLAFALDALTFLVSVFTLWLMTPLAAAEQVESVNMLGAIREALKIVWEDVTLRTLFSMIAVANQLINAPMMVGIPILVDTRFGGDAASYGLIMSVFGGGVLAGLVIAGNWKPADRSKGLILGLVWSVLGLGIVLLGIVPNTASAAVVTGVMGIANGYVTVLFMTWLQTQIPEALMGRIMSLFMVALVGLLPVATALTGALIKLNMTGLFIVSGSLMIVLVLLSMLIPSVRAMETSIGVAVE